MKMTRDRATRVAQEFCRYGMVYSYPSFCSKYRAVIGYDHRLRSIEIWFSEGNHWEPMVEKKFVGYVQIEEEDIV